jgi:hypothetical protein
METANVISPVKYGHFGHFHRTFKETFIVPLWAMRNFQRFWVQMKSNPISGLQ